MNSVITALLIAWLATAGGTAYFSHLEPNQQKTLMNWISGNDSSKSGGDNKPGTTPHAPEINATSGTNAIALIVGGLLLAGERYRSRRS